MLNPREQSDRPRHSTVMADASEKLRALARQSRTLSTLVHDAHRANSLVSLANLYEKQAAEIEARPPEPVTA